MDDKEFETLMNRVLDNFTSKQKDFVLVGLIALFKNALDYLSKLGLADEFLKEHCNSPSMENALTIINDILKIIKIAENSK